MAMRSDIRVMVLDDEPFILKLMSRVLTELEFGDVTACDNGVDALGWVDAPDSGLDLILCDLNMPQMDGIEFLRKLVEHGYEGGLIFVSGEDGRALQAVQKLAHAHGIKVLGTLHKPIRPDVLSRLVEQWTPQALPERSAHGGARKRYGAEAVRDAIAKSELISYFQPQVDTASGQVVGVESLVRWRHPVDGVVFPDQFIGVAEENGLIDDLTRAVVAASFAQARRWLDDGLRLRMAVNVSMNNLASLDFPDFVAGQAYAWGVAPHDVVLEVTESQLMLDLRAPLEILARLRLKRFGLSIDDFGTGHSSLKQLRDMPFDELKIEGSFVHGASTHETERAIYDASLGLARQLEMQTVAEGVEDRVDWDMAREKGCHLAQGYFIARPMPGDDVPGWIRGWQDRVREETLVGG